jgi:hypothetical protein
MPRSRDSAVLELAPTTVGAPDAVALDGHLGAVVRGLWSTAECAAMTAAVYEARARWTPDFGGEQFSLGRAFYTHLETGRVGEYFAGCADADALVESVLPGMQSAARALFGSLVGGRARARRGFGGPGVHIFPSGSKVARRGGVPHWDVEGLAPEHLARRRRAATVVVMLQPAARGGALRVWDAVWDGRDEPGRAALQRDIGHIASRAGDAALISSYRLHQIRPFSGALDRVSVTAHGVEVDAGLWEVWF